MNRQELELLISEYIDGELSLQQRKEVERLLNTTHQAKGIWHDYLAIRQTLQHSVATVVKSDVPARFAQGVLRAIELAEKPGFRNDTINVGTNPQSVLRDVPSSRVPSSWTMFVAQRLRNPRLLSYPLAVLGVVLFLALYYAPSSTKPVQPVSVAQSGLSDQSFVGSPTKTRHDQIVGIAVEQITDDASSDWIADNTDNTGLIDNQFDNQFGNKLESVSSLEGQADQLATVDLLETREWVPEMSVRERIYAPMSDASVKRSDDIPLVQQRTFRVICVLKGGILAKNFFPRFFAQRNVNWTQFTDGSTFSGYEVRVSARSLQEMLQGLQDGNPDVEQCSCDSFDFSSDFVTDQTQMLTVRFEAKTP